MKHIGQPIEQYLKKSGIQKQLETKDYLDRWAGTVGERIAKHARPVALKDGRLHVEVCDSTWTHHLTMLKQEIIADFNRACGEEVISEIRFTNADFYSRPPETGGGKNVAKIEVKGDGGLKKTALQEREKKEARRIAEASPSFYRERLKKLVENYYRQQKWKESRGALICRKCGAYCLPKERRDGYCPCCARFIEEWIGPLKRLLHHCPWLKYEDIADRHPLLDAETYRLARERILQGYAHRIHTLWHSGELSVDQKKKILCRLALRYVLLLEEKGPGEVFEGDLHRALTVFPGLHRFLYGEEGALKKQG